MDKKIPLYLLLFFGITLAASAQTTIVVQATFDNNPANDTNAVFNFTANDFGIDGSFTATIGLLALCFLIFWGTKTYYTWQVETGVKEDAQVLLEKVKSVSLCFSPDTKRVLEIYIKIECVE